MVVKIKNRNGLGHPITSGIINDGHFSTHFVTFRHGQRRLQLCSNYKRSLDVPYVCINEELYESIILGFDFCVYLVCVQILEVWNCTS